MKISFPKEMIKEYGKQVNRDARRKKITLHKAASVLVYIAAMCGEISMGSEDCFYKEITKHAKILRQHGRKRN